MWGGRPDVGRVRDDRRAFAKAHDEPPEYIPQPGVGHRVPGWFTRRFGNSAHQHRPIGYARVSGRSQDHQPPTRRTGRGRLPRDHRGDRQHARRPAEAAHDPHQAQARRHTSEKRRGHRPQPGPALKCAQIMTVWSRSGIAPRRGCAYPPPWCHRHVRYPRADAPPADTRGVLCGIAGLPPRRAVRGY